MLIFTPNEWRTYKPPTIYFKRNNEYGATNLHNGNKLSNLKRNFKVAVDAFVRFVRYSHSELKKTIYAVGKVLGLINENWVKEIMPDDAILNSATALIPNICPVYPKESIRMRFKLSIGDGIYTHAARGACKM